MAKIKLTFTIVKEYEPNPKYYPDGFSLDNMMELDIANAEEDPYLTIGDDADWKITGEIVD